MSDYNSLYELHHGTRKNIVQQLGWSCSICGAKDDEAIWDFHHIVERANGGGNEDSNLTYICPNCHRKYHTSPTFAKKHVLVSIAEVLLKAGTHWHKYYHKTKKAYMKAHPEDK